jgi:predicted metal-dependent hydrolase
VLIRDQTKRWGSCDTRDRLLINWRVVMAPVSLADYILAHEVCHLIIRRHGPGFWRLLETLMPDWLDRRSSLAMEGKKYTL